MGAANGFLEVHSVGEKGHWNLVLFDIERMSQVVRDDAGVTVNHYRPEQYGSFYLCRAVLVLIAALPVEPWPTDEQSRRFQLLRQNPGL